MRDDFYSRTWSERGSEVSEAIVRFLRLLAVSFERLNAIQFEAPWKAQTDHHA